MLQIYVYATIVQHLHIFLTQKVPHKPHKKGKKHLRNKSAYVEN